MFVYGLASGILHGRSTGPGDAVLLHTELLGTARELLLPPERAARVFELTTLQDPGAAGAAELAHWADPRATDYFFRSAPAPVWLGVLAEHAPHLLLPDPAASGRWPAAPFLEPVASADPPGRGRPRQPAATRRSAGPSRSRRSAIRPWTRCWAWHCVIPAS